MKDPYEILGVRKNASQDEIKEAYKTMVKKYHPDKYQNNPLADLAQEKLKEVNEAYDALTRNGSGGNSNYGPGSSYSSSGRSSYGPGGSGYGSGPNYGSGQNQGQGGVRFAEVRQYIDRGDLASAESILSRSNIRDGEWCFLTGMIAWRRGRHDEALSMVQQAVNMEPGNYEYRRAMDTMLQQGGMFRTASYRRGYTSQEDMMCRMCQCYLCTDLLCDCI